MKKSFIIYTAIMIVSVCFSTAVAQIPSSKRSRDAIARVKPSLIKELGNTGFHLGAPIFIRIFKKNKTLEVWLQKDKKFHLFKTYKICTYGWKYLGPKTKQGDGIAPEGFYFVTSKSLNPVSTYHLSFNLGYPNAFDRAHKRTGSALMVHGHCVSIGCYAMTNKSIEQIYTLADAALRKSQKYFRVHIFPFEMTAENMRRYKYSRWFEFWKNLKQGYDFFENNDHIPPNVSVKNKKYVFEKSS